MGLQHDASSEERGYETEALLKKIGALFCSKTENEEAWRNSTPEKTARGKEGERTCIDREESITNSRKGGQLRNARMGFTRRRIRRGIGKKKSQNPNGRRQSLSGQIICGYDKKLDARKCVSRRRQEENCLGRKCYDTKAIDPEKKGEAGENTETFPKHSGGKKIEKLRDKTTENN